jgi:hypothetical protein
MISVTPISSHEGYASAFDLDEYDSNTRTLNGASWSHGIILVSCSAQVRSLEWSPKTRCLQVTSGSILSRRKYRNDETNARWGASISAAVTPRHFGTRDSTRLLQIPSQPLPRISLRAWSYLSPLDALRMPSACVHSPLWKAIPSIRSVVRALSALRLHLRSHGNVFARSNDTTSRDWAMPIFRWK